MVDGRDPEVFGSSLGEGNDERGGIRPNHLCIIVSDTNMRLTYHLGIIVSSNFTGESEQIDCSPCITVFFG